MLNGRFQQGQRQHALADRAMSSSGSHLGITALFLTAILAGSLLGALWPSGGSALATTVDPAIMVLVGLLVFTLRWDGLLGLRVRHRTGAGRTPASRHQACRLVLLALGLNFVVVPIIAFALTRVLVPGDALRLGVLIYCLFPCTDWFLGFTRMAGGNTETGAVLIPIQMGLQLALYPVWLAVFSGHHVASTLGVLVPTLITWFAVPAGAALGLRLLLRPALPALARERVLQLADHR